MLKNADAQQAHRSQIELALCERDYNLMTEHHPALLDRIESAIRDGIAPELIRRWTLSTVDESGLVQRIFNAARYVAQENSSGR